MDASAVQIAESDREWIFVVDRICQNLVPAKEDDLIFRRVERLIEYCCPRSRKFQVLSRQVSPVNQEGSFRIRNVKPHTFCKAFGFNVLQVFD
jgi:hypothetical protein